MRIIIKLLIKRIKALEEENRILIGQIDDLVYELSEAERDLRIKTDLLMAYSSHLREKTNEQS